MVRVLTTLGSEYVALVRVGFSSIEVAILENDGSVTKDKVDGTVDIAFAIELTEGVNVESVLIANEAALVKCREVGIAS